MSEQRNLLLAILLSLAILLGFQFFYEFPRLERLKEEQARQAERMAAEETSGVNGETDIPVPGASDFSTLPPAMEGAVALPALESRADILDRTPRVSIQSPRLHGSIALRGGRIDDLTLVGYQDTLEPDSREVILLSPRGMESAYYARVGWRVTDDTIAVPGLETDWIADRETLRPGGTVKLTWDNGDGLRFEQRISLDDDYMFTMTQRVTNSSTETVTLQPYGLVNRRGTPETLGFYILHEGPLGVFDGVLEDGVKYEDLQSEPEHKFRSTGGWLGITDKYWLVALLPDQANPFDGRFTYSDSQKVARYQVDYWREAHNIPPGGSIEVSDRIFAGAKVVRIVNNYNDNAGVARFDLAIDWGWYPFLTKPIFYCLVYLKNILGNMGVAILALTVVIKLIFFPLANKSYKAMSKMKKLQPKMMELRERFKDDKQRMQQELMDLYKREKANPLSGCLPVLVQIPVFFALYKVLFVSIEMRQAPFFGWIKDLSAPDPTSLLNLFGLLPWDTPEGWAIGIWPLLMGGTMFLQQKISPQPPDPTQAKIMMVLPVLFTFLFAQFAAGLVIYWTWNNVLSIAQQWIIMKRMGVPAS